MRMKNFIFKSPSGLPKIVSLLENIQAEQRHARYDLKMIKLDLTTCVKALAILVSAPEPEDLEQIPELEDK